MKVMKPYSDPAVAYLDGRVTQLSRRVDKLQGAFAKFVGFITDDLEDVLARLDEREPRNDDAAD